MERKFANIAKEDLELGDQDKVNERDIKKECNVFYDWIKQKLDDKIVKVQVSNQMAPSVHPFIYQMWIAHQYGNVDKTSNPKRCFKFRVC